jgi:proline iminopeptidase
MLLGLSMSLYAAFVRPRLLSWGASEQELVDPYPGAEVIAGGKRGATIATTISGTPAQLWPWLVQMGCTRAGWYSWDRLDNGGVPSAQRIHREWQSIELGDRLPSSPSGRAWFEVAVLEPERFLGLRAPLDLLGRPFDTSAHRPRFYSDSLWGFLLTEQPEGQTRVVISGYAASHPRALTAVGDLLFWEPAHWLMQTRQLSNLKRRVER